MGNSLLPNCFCFVLFCFVIVVVVVVVVVVFFFSILKKKKDKQLLAQIFPGSARSEDCATSN